jgi:hypothetical protein
MADAKIKMSDVVTDAKMGVPTPPKDDIKKDLEAFKAETRETNGKILGILENLVNKEENKKPIDNKDLLETPKVPLGEEIQALTPKQQELFERYFDPAEGFKSWYNVNENLFTIEVPIAFTNMSEAAKVLYKQDLRTKKVDQNNVLASIDQWCKLVCQNLRYNRKIKLK